MNRAKIDTLRAMYEEQVKRRELLLDQIEQDSSPRLNTELAGIERTITSLKDQLSLLSPTAAERVCI